MPETRCKCLIERMSIMSVLLSLVVTSVTIAQMEGKGLLVPIPGEGQDGKEPGMAVVQPFRAISRSVKSNVAAVKPIRDAFHRVGSGQFAAGFNILQKWIDQGRDTYIDLTELNETPRRIPEGRLYWGVSHYLRWRLSRLTQKEVAGYRKHNDSSAERLFNLGTKGAHPNAGKLRELVKRFYISSFTDEAIEILGDSAFQNGDMAEARNWYEQLITSEKDSRYKLRYPDPDPKRAPEVFAKYLLTRVALGETRVQQRAVEEFSKRFPERPSGFAFAGRPGSDRNGRSIPLVELLKDALSEDRLETLASNQVDWPTFAGTAVGQALASPPPLYRLDATAESLPDEVEDTYISPMERNRPHYPIAYRGYVWINDGNKITRLNYRDWNEDHNPKIWYQSYQSTEILPPQPLTAYEDRLFAKTSNRGILSLSAITPNRVHWKFTVNDFIKANPPTLGLDSVTVEGAPVAANHLVYVSIIVRSHFQNTNDPILSEQYKTRDHYVVALDAFSGKMRWSTFVGRYHWVEAGVARGFSSVPILGPLSYDTNFGLESPSYEAGKIFCQTNDGTIVSIDSITGEIVWMTVYPANDKRGAAAAPFALSSPIVHGGKLAVTPNDSDQVFLLNADSGEFHWAKGAPAQSKLLGVNDDSVVLAGSSVSVFDLEGGTELWQWSVTEPGLEVYRGVLSNDSLFLPTSRGLIVFDLVDGHLSSLIYPRLQVPMGNLISFDRLLLSINKKGLLIFSER